MQDPAEAWLIGNLGKAASLEVGSSSDLFTKAHGLRFLKAMSEITFFGIYGTFCKSDAFLPSLRKLLEPIFAWPEFFSSMRFNPAYATLFLSLCDVGLRLKLLERSSNAHVMKLCEILCDMGPERVPFRQLDLLYGLENLGFASDPKLRESALRSGCFANEKRLSNLLSSDGYALTHNIFYLTDFGRNLEGISGELFEEVVRVLRRLSVVAVVENNMDLLAEYLLCLGYLQLVDRDTIELSDILKSRQQAEGYWYGPVEMTAALKQLKVPDQLHSFYSNYHTTLLGWQATKIVDGRRQYEPRKLLVQISRCVEADEQLIDEIRGKSESVSLSSDFSFVIWTANRLNFGFQEELDELARMLIDCGQNSLTPNIRNLRLVAGLPIEGEQAGAACDVAAEDAWSFASRLSSEGHDARCYLIRKKLYVEYERNRSAYIRTLALGIIFKVFAISEIADEIAYVDTLYSPDRKYLWHGTARNQIEFVANTGLVGRLLLKAFKEPTSESNNWAPSRSFETPQVAARD